MQSDSIGQLDESNDEQAHYLSDEGQQKRRAGLYLKQTILMVWNAKKASYNKKNGRRRKISPHFELSTAIFFG